MISLIMHRMATSVMCVVAMALICLICLVVDSQ